MFDYNKFIRFCGLARETLNVRGILMLNGKQPTVVGRALIRIIADNDNEASP